MKLKLRLQRRLIGRADRYFVQYRLFWKWRDVRTYPGGPVRVFVDVHEAIEYMNNRLNRNYP